MSWMRLVGTVLTIWGIGLALLVLWIVLRIRAGAAPAKPFNVGDVQVPVRMQGDIHDTDSTECWCEPELLQACPEWSRVTGERCPVSCHACGGKTMVPPYDVEAPMVIVHRRNVVRG